MLIRYLEGFVLDQEQREVFEDNINELKIKGLQMPLAHLMSHGSIRPLKILLY